MPLEYKLKSQCHQVNCVLILNNIMTLSYFSGSIVRTREFTKLFKEFNICMPGPPLLSDVQYSEQITTTDPCYVTEG